MKKFNRFTDSLFMCICVWFIRNSQKKNLKDFLKFIFLNLFFLIVWSRNILSLYRVREMNAINIYWKWIRQFLKGSFSIKKNYIHCNLYEHFSFLGVPKTTYAAMPVLKKKCSYNVMHLHHCHLLLIKWKS